MLRIKMAIDSRTILKNCLNCNNEFNARYYDHLKGMAKFCSRECHNDFRRKESFINGNRVYKICLNCGQKFDINKGELSKGNGKYCSVKCSNEDRIGAKSTKYKKRVQLICVECNKNFEVHSCHAKRAKFCSKNCASRYNYRKNLQMNKGVQRGRGGKRIDLDNMYFRSSWEANYARYLNFLLKLNEIINWEYETDTFEFYNIKRGVRFYTPDFKIFNKDGSITYHEVKGWMDSKSKTRAKRMSKYYPNISVRIIDKKWFRDNGKKLSGLIKNWETGVY